MEPWSLILALFTVILFVTIFLQGKFIRINFDASGFISGANIESCILVECYLGESGERNSGTGLVSKVLPETRKISIFGTFRKIMQYYIFGST